MSDDRSDPIDPMLYRREDMREVLARWDIAALYRALNDDAGLSQRQIAARTGQQQSEVARSSPVVVVWWRTTGCSGASPGASTSRRR
jgi:hypothetical protein